MNEKRERNQCCPHTLLQLVVYDISDKCSMVKHITDTSEPIHTPYVHHMLH